MANVNPFGGDQESPPAVVRESASRRDRNLFCVVVPWRHLANGIRFIRLMQTVPPPGTVRAAIGPFCIATFRSAVGAGGRGAASRPLLDVAACGGFAWRPQNLISQVCKTSERATGFTRNRTHIGRKKWNSVFEEIILAITSSWIYSDKKTF